MARLNAALELEGDQGVGERQYGHTIEGSYDVLTHFDAGEAALSPFARWERYDTQDRVPSGFTRDPGRSVENFSFGISWQPLTQLILKTDYLINETDARTGVDQFNVSLGYIF